MQVNQFIINPTTESPEKLYAFYKDVVGLSVQEGFGEAALNAAGAIFVFDTHSETHGAAKEPTRFLLSLMVDDLVAEQRRIEGHGVKFIRTAGREYWGGVISTFPDPDGNLVQLMEYKPE